MRKFGTILLFIVVTALVCTLGFKNDINVEPNYYYQVYLDDEVLGVIKDKNELEEYIDNQGKTIKEQYKVNKVYAPNGLQVKRILTYSNEIDSVESVYKKLTSMKPFTIQGYQFTIKSEDKEGNELEKVIYTTSKDIFEESTKNTIKAYVGIEDYENYLNDEQEDIKTTGLYIDNVYLDNTILVKSYKIPVTEQIFISSVDLSKYILYGTTEDTEAYYIKNGDTLESIAAKYGMNVEALLISNQNIKSEDSLLYTGEEISIARPDPLVTVIAEYTSVDDRESNFSIEEKYDSSMNIGDEYTVQEGKNGIDRVTSSVQRVNGELLTMNIVKTSVVEPAINKIVMLGSRRVSNIGSLQWWKWPAIGYVTSGYAMRNIGFGWEFHQGIDIAGGGYGSPIYAANNGTVTEVYGTYPYNMTQLATTGYGNYIIINHNNGYWTLYAHMSSIARGLQKGSTVERGQVIGYMGTTGQAYGAHLHYELWRVAPWSLGGYSKYSAPTGNIHPQSVYYR